MYPGHWATLKPHTDAVIDATSGAKLSWQELDQRSNQVAQLLYARGLRPGDHISLLMQNDLAFFEIAWGAYRSGLYITCINRYLTVEEAAYIINDSNSKALFTADALAITGGLPALTTECNQRFITGAETSGYEGYEAAIATQPNTPLAAQPAGDAMLYSSGTTGQPKGIKRPLSGEHISGGFPGVEVNNPYGINADSIYLSPAPLYHAAPFGYCMRTLALGGQVVMMQRFDPELSLSTLRLSNHPFSMGAHNVRAHAETTKRAARSLRLKLTPLRNSCRRPMPGRNKATNDDLVGADIMGVLRRNGAEWINGNRPR